MRKDGAGIAVMNSVLRKTGAVEAASQLVSQPVSQPAADTPPASMTTPTPTLSAEEPVTKVTERGQHSGQLEVRCEGNVITAKTQRSIYHATIGEVYTPVDTGGKDMLPKKLCAVGLVGEEWLATVGPPTGDTGGGRTRGMLLWSFLTRYIKREVRPVMVRARSPRAPRLPTEGLTARVKRIEESVGRVEQKLDVIMQQLGVKLPGGE